MILEKSDVHTCVHCKATFTKEKTFMVHTCEQKRRHLAKDEKHVLIGYQAFNRFYQITQKFKDNKTNDEFTHSPYYNAFVKFGSFINNISPLYPEKFIDWILRSGVKIDYWCRDELYEKYVLELIHTESVETALERSIKHMTTWAEQNKSQWNHYFNYVSTGRAMFDIKDGKISPWLILNAPSGKKMLAQFDDSQLAAISNVINPTVWVQKFKKQTFDLELVKSVIKEAKL